MNNVNAASLFRWQIVLIVLMIGTSLISVLPTAYAQSTDEALEPTLIISGKGTSTEIGWSPDSRSLIILFGGPLKDGETDRFWVWDINSGKLTFSSTRLFDVTQPLAWEQSGSRYAAWDKTGNRLAVPHDGSIDIYERGNDQAVFTLDLPAGNVAWNSDGTLLAANGDNNLLIWNMETLAIEQEIEGRTFQGIKLVAWHPRLPRMAVYHWNEYIDIVDIMTGETIQQLEDPVYQIHGLEWNADGTLIAGDVEQLGLVLWDASTGKMIDWMYNDGLFDWHPTGKWIAFSDNLPGDHDQGIAVIYVMDIKTMQVIYTLNQGSIKWTQLFWSPDGTKLVSVDLEDQIRVWDIPEQPATDNLAGEE